MFNVDKIKEDFTKVIKYNFTCSEERLKRSIDDIFLSWELNKKPFIDAFSGKLTYEIPTEISIDLSFEDKRKYINDFSFYVYKFCAALSDDDYKKYYCMCFKQLITGDLTEEFFCNHLLDDLIMPSPINTIKKGTRITKVIRSIFSNVFNESIIDNIITKYSTIIQENKIKGHLVLSVHPLDFLSASENRHNWRSCHALDGGYGMGNIQYMMDDTTFMAYLLTSDNKKYKLPNFPDDVGWNSKAWRTYFFLKDDVLVAGNSYPFASYNLLAQVVGAAADTGLITKNLKKEWTILRDSEDFPEDDYYDISDKFKNREIVSKYYFNDLTESSSYVPLAYFDRERYPDTASFPQFYIGEEFIDFLRHTEDDYDDDDEF